MGVLMLHADAFLDLVLSVLSQGFKNESKVAKVLSLYRHHCLSLQLNSQPVSRSNGSSAGILALRRSPRQYPAQMALLRGYWHSEGSTLLASASVGNTSAGEEK